MWVKFDFDSSDTEWTTFNDIGRTGSLFEVVNRINVAFDTTGRMHAFVRHGDVTLPAIPVSGISYTETTYSKDIWYHITMTQNFEDISVYVDGVKQLEFNITDTLHQDYRDSVNDQTAIHPTSYRLRWYRDSNGNIQSYSNSVQHTSFIFLRDVPSPYITFTLWKFQFWESILTPNEISYLSNNPSQ